MLNQMKSQVTNLDLSKFKVMLLWDPVNGRDVGWLTVEKDVRVDLSILQVRDIYLTDVAQSSCSIGAGSKSVSAAVDPAGFKRTDPADTTVAAVTAGSNGGVETGPSRRSDRKKSNNREGKDPENNRKVAVVSVGFKRKVKASHGPARRSGRKKTTKSYRETDDETADQLIEDVLGDDSDQDSNYNPEGDKEDDEDIDFDSPPRKTVPKILPRPSKSTCSGQDSQDDETPADLADNEKNETASVEYNLMKFQALQCPSSLVHDYSLKEEPEPCSDSDSPSGYHPVEITPMDNTVESELQQPQNLKGMETDIKNKPFKCKQCPYQAKNKEHLKVHMVKHTGVKHLQCAECPYMSARASDLKKHSKIHSDLKPHQCDLCVYATKNISDLYKHKRNRHNNN